MIWHVQKNVFKCFIIPLPQFSSIYWLINFNIWWRKHYCYSRLENGNKTSRPIMLSRNHELTKFIVLRCHKKSYHNGVKQSLNEFRAELRINCGRSYVWKLLNSCFICKRLQSWSCNYPENSNLPSYRINATVPFQVCGVDYLGPLMVKDIYCKNGNDNMDRACIVIFTCTTSRSVILDLVEDNSSKNFTNSIKRWIARRGCPNKIISDNGTVFKSQDSQLLYSERGITWKFNLDGAPWSRGFWERLVGMVKRCFEKSTGSERLRNCLQFCLGSRMCWIIDRCILCTMTMCQRY